MARDSRTLPKVLIVSIPKAGTNLLMQAILGIPGMIQIRTNIFQTKYSNTDELIKNGEMSVVHLPYEATLERIIKKNNIKVIFISRDLRDVAVSMVHFIVDKFNEHLLYPIFMNHLQDHDQRILAIINGIDLIRDIPDSVTINKGFVKSGVFSYPDIYQYNKSILRWLTCPLICRVKFEDLAGDPSLRYETILKIVDFLWEDLQKSGLNKQFFIKTMNENINPIKSPTFRKANIGDWKAQFNEEHKKAFKTVAGKTLIKLGYEKDSDW
ncbi:sulfotransferase domain-containing protein [Scopulibacillus darangshiensis]|uniref:Sulfotransferase domain-containing protein n=1 Tax=Scopulibacillus darangshiensis TaxID=442528 RepID=A0A4R2NPN7_9BACL|nr:sulfotransferase domain-containing protein [Scopulibacillus darangshiensis]TCP23789.1 sulfotransferase domain-containing protein [Scopulibacillus darangshiensis]